MILRVKELIEVRNVTYEEGLDLVKRTRDRSEGSGVEITGIAFGGSRRKTPGKFASSSVGRQAEN